jgi:hypothetical protein
MNVTLSIEEQLVQRARQIAESMGTSLNQLIRDYLEDLTSPSSIEDAITEMRQLSAEGKGDSRGWKFDREELHER